MNADQYCPPYACSLGSREWCNRCLMALRDADYAARNCYASFSCHCLPADEKRTET